MAGLEGDLHSHSIAAIWSTLRIRADIFSALSRLWAWAAARCCQAPGGGSALHYNGFCLQSDRSAADAGAPATAI